jgi:hypothetical protein
LYGGSSATRVLWKLVRDRETLIPKTPDIGSRQLNQLS